MPKLEHPGKLYLSVFGNIPIEDAWEQMGLWPEFEMGEALEKYQFDAGFLNSQERRLAVAFVVGALKACPGLFSNTHFAMSVMGLPKYELQKNTPWLSRFMTAIGRSAVELQEATTRCRATTFNSLRSFDKRELNFLLDDLVSLKDSDSSDVEFCRPELESFLEILRTRLKN